VGFLDVVVAQGAAKDYSNKSIPGLGILQGGSIFERCFNLRRGEARRQRKTHSRQQVEGSLGLTAVVKMMVMLINNECDNQCDSTS
jgi:hypothetical protein